MTDLDQIARRAGTELRGWAPAGPDEAPASAMGARVRRRRAGRSVAGVAAAALVAVAGVGLAGGDDRPDSTVVPADGGDPAPTTTEPVPSTTTSEVDPLVPPPAPTVDLPVGPEDEVNVCVVELAGGGSMHIVVPPGWLVNDEVAATDEVPGVAFCQVFGPVPVGIGDPQLPDGWGTNGAVSVVPEPVAGFGPAGSWEQYLADRSAVPPAEARVVDGRPALREERSENGVPWLRWTFLLGDTVVTATASESVEAGVSYGEAVAALDEMVATVRHVD